MEVINNKDDKGKLYSEKMHGDKRKGGREGKKRRVNRRICREGLYNLSEGSRRKWLRVQLFEVPIHPGQFLEVSSRAGGGGGDVGSANAAEPGRR